MTETRDLLRKFQKGEQAKIRKALEKARKRNLAKTRAVLKR